MLAAPVVADAVRGLALACAFEPRGKRGKDPWPTVRSQLERVALAQMTPAGRD